MSILSRPLKGGGKKNPKDPFYWVFQEFGWNPASGATGGAKGSAGKRYRRYLSKGAGKAKPGAFFMRAGAGKLGEAKHVIENSLAAAVQRFQSHGSHAIKLRTTKR